MLPEFGPLHTPRDEYEPPYVGRSGSSALADCRQELSLVYGQYSNALKNQNAFRRRFGIQGVEDDPILIGALNTANELGLDDTSDVGCDIGCDCNTVGFSIPNPVKAAGKLAKGAVKLVKKVPVYGHALKAADKVLHSKAVGTIQKVLQNPVVSTLAAPVALPAGLIIATGKGGPEGALNYARMELKNPVRGMAIKAVAVAFPVVAPAAVALEATNRILDAAESGEPAEMAKATAQIAATYALAETGNADAQRAVQYFNKAKEMRKHIPKGPLTPESHPRVAVCGARSEEARGVWFKVHFYMDGPFMKACVYTVAGGDAEIFNLKVDVRPIAAAVAKAHAKLHGETRVSGTLMENLSSVVKKVGKGKLVNSVFKVSRELSTKAKCKAMTPNQPVSDVALAAFAAARKGVDAVDANAKMQRALSDTASNLKRYSAVKNVLLKMSPEARVKAMQNPSVKSAFIKGLGAKFAAASFVKEGGPEKAALLKKNALLATAQFAALGRATKSSDPAVRADAQTMSKVVSIAANARQKTRNMAENAKGGTPGLVIDPRGRLRKGRFTKRTPGKGDLTQVMLTRGGVQTGIFDRIGRSTVPTYSRALRRRIMACRAGCEAELAGVSDAEIGAMIVGRAPIPHYSRALRRRIMACRAGCEAELAGVEESPSPFDIGVTETPVALVGCISCAETVGAVRRAVPARAMRTTPPPKKKPLPRRAAPPRPAPPPKKKPLPRRATLPQPKNPALKAIAKLPASRRIAAAKKIASKLTPAQREELRRRIAAKRAAMGLQPQAESTPQGGGGGGGGGGANFDDGGEETQDDEAAFEDYTEEDLDEELNPEHESYGEDAVVEDPFGEETDEEVDEQDWDYTQD